MASIQISGLPEEKAEKLARLLEKLADNADALEDILEALAKMKDTGLLAGTRALAESFEEGFNYLMRPEFVASIGNMMMLLYMISKMDHPMMFEMADKMPPCIKKAYDEFMQAPSKRAGLMELLNLMRSPEFYAMMRAMRVMLSCARQGRATL